MTNSVTQSSGGLAGAQQIAASGLLVAGAQLAVTADNLANLDTSGYRQRQADVVELSGGGAAVTGVSQAPNDAGASNEDGSDVDPAQQVVQLDQAQLLYTASARVAQTAEQTLGTLLDTLYDDSRR